MLVTSYDCCIYEPNKNGDFFVATRELFSLLLSK